MLLQGDAMKIPLPTESVDLIVMSPPYLNAREYSQWKDLKSYLADMRVALIECFRVLKTSGRIAINVPQGYGRPDNGRDGYIPFDWHFTGMLMDIGFLLRGHIIWNKGVNILRQSMAWGSWRSATNPSLRDQHEIIIVAHKGRSYREKGENTIDSDTFIKATSSIWFIPPISSDRWHPAPFPSEIPRRLIELYTFVGDIVCDPFSGTGTTERMAISLGRKGIGIDLNYDYCRRAKDSLPQLRLDLVVDPME